MIINPKIEMMPTTMRDELVWSRLQKNLKWAYEKSAFYHEKYLKANVKLSDIKQLSDITKLPLTTFDELQHTSAFDLLTGPLNNTIRLNKTLSGLYRGLTMDDITRNIDIALRPLASNEINKTSMLVLCGEYSSQYLLDTHYAAESLGATVIPCKDAKTAEDVISIFRANTLVATAVCLKEIVDDCQNYEELPAKIIVLADDSHLELISQIEKKLGRFIPKIYLAQNLGITGLIFTCEQRKYHIQDDYFYPEVIDGYLVVTALTFEAMPIIRLQTGRKVKLLHGCSCGCGRTFTVVEI